MKINYSSNAREREREADLERALEGISVSYLRQAVEAIAIPRHAVAEAANNKKVARWIKSELESFGYEVEFQGRDNNVVALLPGVGGGPLEIVGAHYDSVPQTPGADDNASAVAALLGCAKALSQVNPGASVCFVAFNREEDGFLGSSDFVSDTLLSGKLRIKHAHILEMVGYASQEKGSQMAPPMLPIKVPDVGNFLGILGNSNSTKLVDEILSAGKSYLPDFPVIGLKLYLGAERLIPNMTRSDHVSFWLEGIPATMWTDTADFRNPNYHLHTDTPETLDYNFLANVTRLLLASLFHSEK
ncbi:MAG TPA: M28 family peptidase [Pyrinomonadaceae bacterium]